MKREDCDIFFLNPNNSIVSKIQKHIEGIGFKEVEREENNCKYQKDEANISLSLNKDFIGPYVALFCENILIDNVREWLSVCPECGSNNVKISILFCWRNSTTDQLYKEGKLDYGPGAYDRFGTRPETHRCLKCGCEWHNGAALLYWNEIVSQGRELTKEDLGLM